MKKRILSILLALCMCLTFVPVTVLAEDLPQQDNSIRALSISPDPDNTTYYTYEFYVNDNKVNTQIVKNGDTLLEPQVEAQAGKVFTHWDPAVPFGTVSGLTGENKTIRVDAVFADGYYVYFKDNTGRIIATKTGTTGQTITFEDVSFAVGTDEAITGWYTDKDCTDGNKVTSVTIENSNITLYAKVEKGYWITFESNDGSYVAPVFYATSATAAAPAAPTQPGYTFAGWYTDEGLTTQADFATIKTNTTVYAKWTAANQTNYTVIHWQENVDDDKFSFKESETKTGTTGELTTAAAKSYDGFTGQMIEQKIIAGDGSTIVNVYYTRNVYTINFYGSTLSCGKEEHRHNYWQDCYDWQDYQQVLICTKEEHTHGNSCYETVLLSTITAKHGASISNQWPARSNGSTNWSTAEDGEGPYQAGIDVMPIGGDDFYEPDNESSNSASASYYVEVLEGESGTEVGGKTYKLHHTDTVMLSNPSVTAEDFYDITGFTKNTAASTQNGDRYNGAKFYYYRNSYEIKFINGGNVVNTVSKQYEADISDVSYTPATAPTGKDGYTFAGWYDNELCEGTPYVFTGKMPAKNITLYAKWVAPTYTVTVHDMNGDVLHTFSEVAKNSTISSDSIPTLELAEGETFLGWVQEDGTPFNFNTKINQNYDLYAKVGNNSRYTVTYHSNTASDTTITNDAMIYAKDVFATVDANTFTNGSNKVFLSWNTKSDGSGTTYYPNGTIKVTGNMDLYAIWGDKASTVTVTYHSNFGTDQEYTTEAMPNNEQITVADYSALGLPNRVGYSFTGWNTEADGNGTAFAAGASARVDIDGSNDLYAQWTPNQYRYTVEYYIDGVKDDNLTVTNQADFGAEISSYPDKCPGGYVLDKTEGLPLTIGVTESENVINVFYKKNVFDLTIHYVYAGGGMAAADHKESVTFGDPYGVTSPTIDGYTADQTTVSGTMPANNVEVTVTYSKRTDLSYTVNYYWNGTTEKVADSKTVDGQTFNASVTETPITISGCTPVSNDRKTITITTDTNVINFYYYKNVELTANSATYTYNGTEKSVSGFTSAPGGADFSAITVGAKGTDAGTYDANFAKGTVGTVDTTEKYIVTKATDGQLVITPVADKVTVTITGHETTAKYDGTEKEASGYDVSIDNSLYTENDFTFSGTATVKGTNVADSKEMGLKAEQFTNTNTNFTNVEFDVTDGSLEITKRNVTLTSATDSKVYDGQPLTNDEVTVDGDGFAYGEGATYDVTGTITNVGTVKNAFTYTLNEGTKADNYNITKDEGKLTVNPVTDKVTVTITENSGSEKYDGTEKTVTGYKVKSISNTLYTESDFTFNGTATVKGTDAGKYDMELKASDFQNTNPYFTNVEFVIVDGQLEITKRNVTLTSATDEKVYDGQPLTNDEVTVDGDGFANGEGATYDVTGTITDAGTVNNTFTYTLSEGTKADNYNITKDEGTLTVTPVTDEVIVTIKGNTKSEIYDGIEKTVTGYEVVSISNPLYEESDFTFSGTAEVKGTNVADSKEMGLKAEQFTNTNKNFNNVEFNVTDGSLEIKQRDVTITGESASKTYNGKVQEITGITVEGLVDGHSLTGLTYSAKGKDAGEYDGSFTGRTVITDTDGKDVTDNYNVKTVAGVLTITRYYHPYTPSTPVTSVETGDMGIALYAMTSLLSLSGAVAIVKKRKEDEK